jgi:hypothetical protein
MNLTLKPEFGLNGSAMKVIAMISMVIDHVALYLMEHGTVLYGTMRCIGRIAFPVFAFLIAEGFIHTRSRYRYFFTLLGFAVISEIPWYLLNGADGTHNVMFTLALGVATLMVLENLLQRSMVLGFLWTLGMAGLASWLGVDYGNHTIFRHDNFIGCFSADKIKMSARKYFCFNIRVYKSMAEESSCRSPYHEEYIQTSASGNPEGLCH